MPLTAGTRLGPYEILASIGAGGMGEVYRARDTKLKRDVALKVLPEAFARDPDRMARFQHEAEVLAALNHPNIAAIYGLEDSTGTVAIVMELVQGRSLAEKIRTRGTPLPEVLNLAIQVACGLEAAHKVGIVHRDLKPSNVMVTPAGVVKLLDFGRAKVLEEPKPGTFASSCSPTRCTMRHDAFRFDHGQW
jgi:serine/threonine protein kinase